MKIKIFVCVIATTFFGFVFPAVAATYSLTELKPLGDVPDNPNFPLQTWAYGINDAGQVVGESDGLYSSAYRSKAVIWNNGNPTALGTPDGQSSAARGINNAGQVVGTSSAPATCCGYATVWNGITPTYLSSVGWSHGNAINNAGQVAGNMIPPILVTLQQSRT